MRGTQCNRDTMRVAGANNKPTRKYISHVLKKLITFYNKVFRR